METEKQYREQCEDCIHYTEKSYGFGDCELCNHEVACDAVCTQYAERWVRDNE